MVKKVTELLKKKFTISAEIIPPRNGAHINDVFKSICTLRSVDADFVSVTMGAGGSLRGGSLPIANMVQEKVGLSCVAHFVCRDFTPEEVENHLIDHHYFGLRNILALRGDPPYGLEGKYLPREGSYKYAYQLVEQISRMKEGKYLVRQGYDKADKPYVEGEKVDFCVGVAAYPEFYDPKLSVQYLRRKIEAGAEYAITQMVFDSEALFRFRDKCVKNGVNIPLIPGLRVLKGPKACALMEKLFKIKVPDSIKKPLMKKKKGEGSRVGGDLALNLINEWKKEGFEGVHVFLMEDIETASKLIKDANNL